MPLKIVVYVLCYDADTEAHARREFEGVPWARVMFIPTTMYLEGAAYAHSLLRCRHEWADADYVGTLSWKAVQKLALPHIPRVCARRPDADVIALLPGLYPLLEEPMTSRPEFKDVWVPLLCRLGYSAEDAASPDIPTFYCNYWLCRPPWMDRYITFFVQAKGLLDTWPRIQEALWSDSDYEAQMPVERCRQIWGVPYYPFHPFVGERLPCFFFWKEGASVYVHQPRLVALPGFPPLGPGASLAEFRSAMEEANEAQATAPSP